MADLSTIARPYARALFDIANAAGNLAGWSDALRAAATSLSASACALTSALWPLSAAASPSAMAVWRASIAVMITGQMYFMQNQTKKIMAIVWPSKVPMLMSTRSLLVTQGAGAALRAPRLELADRGLELADERIGECEEECDTDTDHRHRVEQRDDEEHLRP